MPGSIATAYVQVIPTTEGITGNLENVLGGAGEAGGSKAGKSFVAKFGKALAGSAAVKATVDFFKAAINQGAELQQNLGGTEAVFGHYAVNV